MRIFGFVLSAVVLHVVVLALTLDNNMPQAEGSVVGVALVQRQLDPFVAITDVPSGGQELKLTESQEAPLAGEQKSDLPARTQEFVNQPTRQEMPAEVDPRPLESEELFLAVADEAPTQPVQRQQQLLPSPEPVVTPSPDNTSAPFLEHVDLPIIDPQSAAETLSATRTSLAEQSPLKSATSQADAGTEDVRESIVVQVAAQPRYGYTPAPAYPGIARRRGWEGTAELKVRVLASGDVGEVKLESSSGYRSLDAAAHRAIKRWRFAPASRAGRDVESWVVVPVHFVLDAQRPSR